MLFTTLASQMHAKAPLPQDLREFPLAASDLTQPVQAVISATALHEEYAVPAPGQRQWNRFSSPGLHALFRDTSGRLGLRISAD